jgi:hypothetical protein
VEHITLITATTFSREGMRAEFNRLWIGHEEIAITDRSISQCLEQMYQQGWTLTTSRAHANLHGIRCEYDFERPIPILSNKPLVISVDDNNATIID